MWWVFWGFLVIVLLIRIASRSANSGTDISNVPDPKFQKVCPECAERVKYAANRCRYCGFQFPLDENNLEEYKSNEYKLINNYDGTFLVSGELFYSEAEALEYIAQLTTGRIKRDNKRG